MHDEFLLQYQIPILKHFGLVAYGCCEDLTEKIGILRQIPNLRVIAAAPRADVARCAEQIGSDYVISWRPNPTDMVCGVFDETRIRRILRHGLTVTRGCTVHVHLKDIETVEGDPDRLRRWVRLVRDVEDECR
jgi:transketolase C-terminal domain/subunit